MKTRLLTLLLVSLFTTFGTITASASYVRLCYTNSHGDRGCCYARGTCASLTLPKGWDCLDGSTTLKATITRTANGGATLTIGGVTYRIASEAFESRLTALCRQATSKNANPQLAKQMDYLWNSPGSWKVSEQQLKEYAKDFNTTISAGSK
ncbi:MAG: hypothetical protein Q8922_09465 [Bacteroidota bacterium]|nr:hypothetical protein [Bacteroidota bacterium]MDP4234420.1 hypothetical protein [Bacteroidota bacterium]MDP4243986.1 hypothetical protein [Bacteroidota bacterium]MDP4288152.1 hypothetical protein [Bacteroidota bacterium]